MTPEREPEPGPAAPHRLGAVRAAFVRACELDVRVRKPGNVSLASAGHGMNAGLFLASARAAAGPLCQSGTRLGQRVEAAMQATLAVAGCNTNLGILLLCAPVALALERRPDAFTPEMLQSEVGNVLAQLDGSDAQAAYRAIASANPGGLGAAPEQDVRNPPSVDLRAAMALAADRDSIALQYRDNYAQVFDIGVRALGAEFVLGDADAAPDAATIAAVQRAYLALLSAMPDSHIARKRGDGVAHAVMRQAQPWLALAQAGADLDADPAFRRWDAQLKADGINPGTTADLTVASMLSAGLCRPGSVPKRDGH